MRWMLYATDVDAMPLRPSSETSTLGIESVDSWTSFFVVRL